MPRTRVIKIAQTTLVLTPEAFGLKEPGPVLLTIQLPERMPQNSATLVLPGQQMVARQTRKDFYEFLANVSNVLKDMVEKFNPDEIDESVPEWHTIQWGIMEAEIEEEDARVSESGLLLPPKVGRG